MMAERKRTTWKFDPRDYVRKRPVAWNGDENKAIYHDDLMSDDGKVDEGKCKALGVAPGSVRPFTFTDLGADYATLERAVKAHVKATAAASADDLIFSLIAEDAMQREINWLVSKVRPNNVVARATNILAKLMKEQGKSEQEIAAAFAALGIK